MASTAYERSVVCSGRQAYDSYTGEILLTKDLARSIFSPDLDYTVVPMFSQVTDSMYGRG